MIENRQTGLPADPPAGRAGRLPPEFEQDFCKGLIHAVTSTAHLCFYPNYYPKNYYLCMLNGNRKAIYMKVIEHIQKAQKTLFSFEIIPPKQGEGKEELFCNINPLMEFNPPFIEITTSREELVSEQGSQKRLTTRTRPGTIGLCAAIQHKYQVDTVPHLLCGGFSKEETEYALFDLTYLGIDSVLALRGDAMKHEKRFVQHPNGHSYANQLIEQIKAMNEGKFLYNMGKPSNFCIGAAGYPEVHFEAPSFEIDLENLKRKVDAGADYIITQMFFDNQKYFDFCERCRQTGIVVPIIPAIKPIAIKRHLEVLPSAFSLEIPDTLKQEVEKCHDNKQVRQVGIEWAIKQSKELVSHGVPLIHYYTMSRSSNIYEIAKEVF